MFAIRNLSKIATEDYFWTAYHSPNEFRPYQGESWCVKAYGSTLKLAFLTPCFIIFAVLFRFNSQLYSKPGSMYTLYMAVGKITTILYSSNNAPRMEEFRDRNL